MNPFLRTKFFDTNTRDTEVGDFAHVIQDAKPTDGADWSTICLQSSLFAIVALENA